jgi:hypothetical protein
MTATLEGVTKEKAEIYKQALGEPLRGTVNPLGASFLP